MENSNETNVKDKINGYLEDACMLSHEKMMTEKKADKDRRDWGRLLVHASQARGERLDAERLDKLEKSIQEIKERLGLKT